MAKTIHMIQLTKDIIAVEVPSDATDILLIHDNTRLAYFHPNYKRIDLDCRAESLVGVTPLSEEQWKEVVLHEVFGNFFDYVNPNSGDYARGYMCQSFTESGLSLLESKGLDVNKKYAIIKIEK